MATSAKNPIYEVNVDDVQVFEGDDALDKTIGKDVDLENDVFSEDKIAACQGLIDEAVAMFFQDNKDVIDDMQKACLELSEGGAADELASRIGSDAQSLKSQAETLGFVLVARVSQSLFDYCAKAFQPGEAGQTIVSKHVETLHMAFQHNLTGSGGEVGAELLKGLEQLIAKFNK